MSEKQRLLDTLFSNKKREHVNIKFFRQTSVGSVTAEEFCAAVNHALFQVDTGIVKGTSSFKEAHPQINVSMLKTA